VPRLEAPAYKRVGRPFRAAGRPLDTDPDA